MNRKKDVMLEKLAQEAVERHHAQMAIRLRELAGAVTEAVEARDTGEAAGARDLLVSWCESELIPHALAEEGPLYSGPGQTERGRLLVAGMLEEHRVIVRLVEELRQSDGVRAAVAAGAVERIFGMHLEKENQLLVPLIAELPELSLADAVAGLGELVGDADLHHGGTGH